MKLKPKRFGPIRVVFDGADQMRYGVGAGGETSLHPPAATPVDTMLAALGACIVKSMEWAAAQHKVALTPFEVEINGTKSLDLPGRVERLDIAISGRLVEDADLAARLVAEAKSICTVSNSLNSQVEISHEAE
ncbi:MAG: OsmC family protein [Silicimonas sp.]|nr:OsmC family protein [Silicimonas sp.]